MARTFTGLKLQGSIGKFGNQELSDVSGYTQLPDGKVSLIAVLQQMFMLWVQPVTCSSSAGTQPVGSACDFVLLQQMHSS